MVQNVSTNTYGTAKWIVSATASNGTHTTIAAALTSASSGDTIFIRTGSYTEDLTLKAGVDLVAFRGDSDTPNVTIIGNCTLTGAGTVTISNIRLQTNSAALLTVSGSAASIVNLNGCYLNCSNNSGITFSSSSASAIVNIYNCKGDLGTTGIALFSMSSAGLLNIAQSVFSNTGSSTTASTISAGAFLSSYSIFTSTFTTSSTGIIALSNVTINCGPINTVAITNGGSTASNAAFCSFGSGTASAITISTTLSLYSCVVVSNNTNAITGAGTLVYVGIIFQGTSSKINTTTQTGGVMQGGQTQTPSAGFIGEQINSSVTAVAMTSGSAKSVTSISLTPGIWDIGAIGATTATGGTAVQVAIQVGISTTNNAFSGTLGIEYFQLNSAATICLSGAVPSYRAVLTATTTYYLVMLTVYSSTTCPANGRISATRVG